MNTVKKALLVVSFGTSYLQAIENCIAPVEKAIGEAAPGFDVYRAFTSGMIIRKLKDVCKISIPSPEEALLNLAGQGYKVVAVQPTHILAGTEYHDLARDVETFAAAHPDISGSGTAPAL